MRRRLNSRVIALIIEISLLFIGSIVVLIFDQMQKSLPILPVVIIAGILIFSLVLTLSIIRYESLRDIRSSDVYKGNLPIYTDKTTMICHDLKDESENHQNNE